MQHISEWSMCESARTMVDQPILVVRGALLDDGALHHHVLPQRRDAAVWLLAHEFAVQLTATTTNYHIPMSSNVGRFTLGRILGLEPGSEQGAPTQVISYLSDMAEGDGGETVFPCVVPGEGRKERDHPRDSDPKTVQWGPKRLFLYRITTQKYCLGPN